MSILLTCLHGRSAGSSRQWTSLSRVQGCAGTVLTLNVRVALVGFVGGGPCSCTAIHGAIYGHRGGLWAPVMAPVRIVLFMFCVLPPPVQKIAIRRKQLPGSSCNCSRRRLQKLAGSSDCVIQGCTFSRFQLDHSFQVVLVETYAGDAPLRPAKKLAMDARVPVECSPILGTRCLRCRLAGPLRSSSINGVVNVKPLSNCTCCRSPAGIIETRKNVTQTAIARRGTYVSTKVSASWRRGTSIRRQSKSG